MVAGRAFVLRPSVRAIFRRHGPSQLTRPLGRRGYASSQVHAAKSSDMPWQIAAIAVTVPGLIYLRGGRAPKPSHDTHGSHEEGEAEHEAKASEAESKTGASDKDASEQNGDQQGEANESKDETAKSVDDQQDKTEDSKRSRDSGGDTASSSTNSQSKTMDDSQENQAQKLTDKPASQRVDPTEK